MEILLKTQEKPVLQFSTGELSVYQWRDRKGVKHFPSDMETRHIFYVLAMIWHHKMPSEAKLFPRNRYTFGPYYTDEYFLKSIVILSCELFTRTDLTPFQKECLAKMKAYFEDHFTCGHYTIAAEPFQRSLEHGNF